MDVGALIENLRQSAFFVVDPGQRLFWFSLLMSVLLALVVLRLQGHRLRWRFLRRVFLSRSYWFSTSAREDLRWLTVNVSTKAVLATLFVSAQLVVTIAVAKVLQQHFGSAAVTALPWLAIAALYSLVFFVAEDLSRFLTHLAMHRVPFLWRFHRVHHGATRLTPLTLHRVHPVETCIYYARGVLVFGLVSGVFVYAFGSRLTALDILGVDALGFLFNAFGANLRHSHIWMSFGHAERVFISPAQHQLHHSNAAEHRDRNFGTCLAVWDRVHGSWLSARGKRRRLIFGLAPAA